MSRPDCLGERAHLQKARASCAGVHPTLAAISAYFLTARWTRGELYFVYRDGHRPKREFSGVPERYFPVRAPPQSGLHGRNAMSRWRGLTASAISDSADLRARAGTAAVYCYSIHQTADPDKRAYTRQLTLTKEAPMLGGAPHGPLGARWRSHHSEETCPTIKHIYKVLRFASRSLAVWRVCAIALSFVSGWRAFCSVSLCRHIQGAATI
jgi:hypothetical protein